MVVSKVTRKYSGMAQHPFLCLEVIDSGAGISKENQKKLFGQYVQFNANSLQKGGGSGLGLWISKGARGLICHVFVDPMYSRLSRLLTNL
jgi:signal transduction histidine kinase